MKQWMKGLGLSLAVGMAASSGPVMGQSSEELKETVRGLDFDAFTTEDRQEFCGAVRNVSDQMSQQLPMAVDAATQLVGVSTLFVNDVCKVNYGYVITERPLFEMLQGVISQQAGEQVPMAFVEQFYGEGEGYQALQNGIRQELAGDPDFSVLLEVPFVQISARYNIVGEHLKPFTIRFGH